MPPGAGVAEMGGVGQGPMADGVEDGVDAAGCQGADLVGEVVFVSDGPGARTDTHAPLLVVAS